ncbi:Organic cation transporter protein [Pseudolycoriella hygida]|uniref:Organic cation transporter protein n=1 Tax=Pseudolycoriella hygida TaxID=35572 RepID=A0A9Q0RU34_9DIPT|nr:Organic cation transporter protein [Pseudolycoriella hygida]
MRLRFAPYARVPKPYWENKSGESTITQRMCYSDKLSNLTFEEIKEIYSTYEKPSCSHLNLTESLYFVELESGHTFEYLRSDVDEVEENPVACRRWIYKLDYGYRSMTSDLNWVCDSAWKSTLGQSLFFIGSVIGSLCFGVLADHIGRLHVLVVSNLMAMIGNGATIFATNVTAFGICRFIAGLATDTNFVMMYILVMEYIRPSMRTFGLNLCIGIFYCIGSMICPWIAVAVGDWRTFLLVTSLPVLVVPLLYFFVAESALWLVSKNNIDGAVDCFIRVAKFNKQPLSEEDVDEFRKEMSETRSMDKRSTSTLIGLFKTPRLRRLTFILFFKSMVITLCYDAISRNVEGLGLSPFIMFSLSATAIFPACVVLLLLQDIIGRKAMAASSLLISGVFTAATGFVMAYQEGVNDPLTLASLSIIGRFGVTVAYNSAAQYATELIPTCVRGQGVAAVHVAGYALTFFSSYILYLSNIFKPLPALLLGSLSLIGSVLVLFLPETLNRVIPSTLEDGERFGMGERFFDFSCFEKKREMTESTVGLSDN